MSGFVLFHMWEPLRQSLIKGHVFYVEQAQKRLLSQFGDIEGDANKAAEEWLEQSSQYFDPDRHDPEDFYDEANEVSIEFYGLLTDMREQTRLSVVAGMYHEWDKQLRQWLVGEMQHWRCGENAIRKVWSVDFGKIADLLESFGWNLRNKDYFHTLDACRLVVNVYKHGEGNSLRDLKNRFPEYLHDWLKEHGLMAGEPNPEYLDHTHLKVSDDQFQAFSDAIVAFWRDVPENFTDSQSTDLPDWFAKVIQKDRSEPQ